MDKPAIRSSDPHHESDQGTHGSYERDLRILAELLLEIYTDRHSKTPAQAKVDDIDAAFR